MYQCFKYLIQIKAQKFHNPVVPNLIFVFSFCCIFVFIVMFLVSLYILKHI